jgi:Ca2+-binding EF-hand superfamily protein
MRLSTFVLIAACLLPLVACAQSDDRRAKIVSELKERFAKADTDGDGALNREEAKAMPRLASHFDEIDTNRDGRIDMPEIGKYIAAKRNSK